MLFAALTGLGIFYLSPVVAQGNTDKLTKADSSMVVDSTRGIINEGNLVTYAINLTKTTHIISPENILYIDISSPEVDGELSEKNICELKPKSGAFKEGQNFQVTIVTEAFIAVYKLVCHADDAPGNSIVISIDQDKAFQTNSYNKVGKQEFYRLSMMALNKRRRIFNIHSKEYGMEMWVNNIFVVGDFLLFDLTAKNKTKMGYNVEAIRFQLRDKNNVNAHVSQEIELQPLHHFYNVDNTVITGKWRNFFIFRKFTYPGEKVFHIELTEKQVSGRRVEVDIDYNQVLHSDYLL